MNKTQKNMFVAILEGLSEPGFLLGPDSHVRYANPELLSRCGRPLTGERLSDVITFKKPDDHSSPVSDFTAPRCIDIHTAQDVQNGELIPLKFGFDDGSLGFLVRFKDTGNDDPDKSETTNPMGGYVVDLAKRTVELSGSLIKAFSVVKADGSLKLSDWLACFEPLEIADTRKALNGDHEGVIKAALSLKLPGQAPVPTHHDIHVMARDAAGYAIRFNGLIYPDNNADSANGPEIHTVSDLEVNVWTRNVIADTLDLKGPIVEKLGLGKDAITLPRSEWLEYTHPEDRHIVSDVSRVLKEKRETPDFSHRIKSPDGTYFRVKVKGTITEQDADGNALRVSGILSEMSPSEWYQHQLQQTRNRMADALTQAGISTWGFDLETGQVTIEGPAVVLLDPTRHRLTMSIGRWNQWVHPDDIIILDNGKVEIFETGSTSMEFRMSTHLGHQVWLQMWGTVDKHDPQGRPVHLSCFSSEITERKNLEEALLDERSRLNAIYQETPAMMRSFDRHGTTTMVSEYFCQQTGFSRDDIIGQSIGELAHPEDRAHLRDHLLEKLFAEGALHREPLRVLTKTGDYLDTRLSAFVERAGDTDSLAHAVCEDVTDINRARIDVEAYAEELERTNRELDRFATVASHDLQEPLRKISAFSSLLRRRYEGQLDHEADRSLEYLTDAAGRMWTLIDDLLTYSRTSSRALDHQAIDLNRLLKEIVNGLGLAIEESGAEIKIPSLPEISGDPLMISQLFQNLISNSIKYRRSDVTPQISISAEAIGRDWRFKIEDNGIGMEDRFREKIFAPFQRLHSREDYEGSGIGLAICQQAVERHGGSIWVESKAGIGSKFYFTLPRQIERVAVA